MKVSKVRDVKSPNRGTSQSSGIDFFVPVFNDKFILDLNEKNPIFEPKIITRKVDELIVNSIKLDPQERILIPSGIHINLNLSTVEGFPIKGKIGVDFVANNKSGIGAKKGLCILSAVVDMDYSGEIHISLVNTSNKVVFIDENEKIVQFILRPVILDSIDEVPFESLYTNFSSERGDKGFGNGTGN